MLSRIPLNGWINGWRLILISDPHNCRLFRYRYADLRVVSRSYVHFRIQTTIVIELTSCMTDGTSFCMEISFWSYFRYVLLATPRLCRLLLTTGVVY